jgi:very-short-patch-repair endonuclease
LAWKLAARQHWVVTRRQLLELGFTAKEIECRLADARLHQVWRSVYAVGRPHLAQEGRWMAAVLACGLGSVLSHGSAGALWGILSAWGSTIHVSIPSPLARKRPGIAVHRRRGLAAHVTRHHGIPVTTPALTIVDLAACNPTRVIEEVVNAADTEDLIDPETLRSSLADLPRVPGIAAVRRVLDQRTFVLTDSALERRFLPIVRRAGLPKPLTRHFVDGFRVDFYWPDLRLVVETDGLRYHRTPSQQARDRRRDQAHTAAGRTPLRFTHAQVWYEPATVERTLKAVTRRLRANPPR